MAVWETDPRDLTQLLRALELARAEGDDLLWMPSIGLGACPAQHFGLYGKEYWEEYRRRDLTNMAAALCAHRKSFVRRFAPALRPSEIVDIGIGGGRFMHEMGCDGYDINPYAEAYLRQRFKWHNPFEDEPFSIKAVTMWDVIEHAWDWSKLFHRVRERVFLSTPIYANSQDCRRSRHYKPGEHLLYFTEPGLIWYMKQFGFMVEKHDDFESRLGRDSIDSYVFVRV